MVAPQLLKYKPKHFVTFTIVSINTLFFCTSVVAQIISDDTLNTQINLVNGQQNITGGIEVGTNLFHSFQEFSPTPEFATYFNNNPQIENIFTRVTGGSISLINGLIKTNDNASLFLLNPAGIILGNNAQLDIGGSFIATTAESIIFTNGVKFSSQIKDQEPLLTVSIPLGLQYGVDPGSIVSSNNNPINLTVTPKNTVALLGGEIQLINTSINALSGRVEIAGVGKNQIVNLTPAIHGWEFNYDNVIQFNDIEISQQSQFNTSGEEGIVNLRGQNISLNNNFTVLNQTETEIGGGIIFIKANNSVNLSQSILSTQVGLLDDEGFPLDIPVTGKGGNIFIVGKDVNISNGSVLSASTISQGEGGDITINGERSLTLSGFDQFTPSLIATTVGDIGAGGTIEINTGKLIINDGTRIDSSSFGVGNAGTVIINASESILISGNSFISDREFPSGVFASSGIEGIPLEAQISGESGSLILNTPLLSLETGGQVSVSNFGQKNAGNVQINADKLVLDRNGQIIAQTASGNGGSINLTNSQIVLQNNSSISATADRNGDGGNININTDNLVLFDRSKINANANFGTGGNITITTQGLFNQKPIKEAIAASSQLGIDGVVEIINPDLDDKIDTTQQERSPISAEDLIDTGCGLGSDFAANQFRYIGRGGIPLNPFNGIVSKEVVGDLGTANSLIDSSYNSPQKTVNSIQEATTWIINEQGNIELIAQLPFSFSSFHCK